VFAAVAVASVAGEGPLRGIGFFIHRLKRRSGVAERYTSQAQAGIPAAWPVTAGPLCPTFV